MTALMELDETKTQLAELVRAAAAGDRLAFGQLVERYERAVYNTALRRLGNHAEAQELAQEVFVHGMRKLPQLRDPRCFAGWLRRITARMAINRLTRRGPVSGTTPEFLDSVEGRVATPLEQIELNEAKAELHEGLSRLKPLDRATLEAFYLRGRSLKQMSREFETPVGTIKRRLHVARQRLKEALQEPASPLGGGPRARHRRELACV